MQRFRLHRSWTAGANGCRERFHVLRDGELDKLATEHWAEQVEDFIPARIAHLFLFDGEKIESYAELGGASDLIATAVQNLLGLDIVERLAADLIVLERRRRADPLLVPRERSDGDEVRADITRLEAERQRLVRERAAVANELDRRARELAEIEERFRREGGELFERRAELEGEAVASERQLILIRKELRELAAGSAPLLLVRDLLAAVALRHEGEQAVHRNRQAVSAIVEEHQALLELPALAKLGSRERKALKEALATRLAQRRIGADEPTHLDLSADASGLLNTLTSSDLPDVRERLDAAIAGERAAAMALDDARAALAASPNYDAIAGVVTAREAARAEVERLRADQNQRDADLARLERELGQRREREARLAEAEARERFEHEDQVRLQAHSTKVRATLARLREAVVERHVARIQRLVLESFHQLIRKQSLVTDLRIDPRTFVLELRGADQRLMTPDRLSAGERQLLAIAMLWGLGKASGRPVQAVIDTPLGRLDSEHRSHLVNRYFPNASHQVLLLSTDEEITGPYHEALRPWIDRTYRLRFDEAEGRTIVEQGYLADGARGHAA